MGESNSGKTLNPIKENEKTIEYVQGRLWEIACFSIELGVAYKSQEL